MVDVGVGLLGPVEVTVDGRVVAVPSLKQRSVLAALALSANRPVSVDALVDAVWGDAPPPNAEHSLQQHISAVRRLLEPDRPGGTASTVLVTRQPGYALHVDRLDVDAFDAAAAEGFDATSAAAWRQAGSAFDTALACWRGAPLADVRGSGRLDAAAVRLEEKHLAVSEGRADVRLALGEERELIPELERLIAEHPLRERLRGQLMLALYRTGRQADALAAYRSARAALTEQLGIEPGAALRQLEQAILEQSPSLDAGSPAGGADVHETFRSGSADLGRVELPDGQVVVLPAGRSLIGRDPAALVRLVDNRVSRTHARIDAAEDGCTLHDLGSSNGTLVNGAPVTSTPLADGDVISVGGVEVRFSRPT